MIRAANYRALEAIRAAAHGLRGAAEDYDPLMDLIGDARLVLLGEASHGTHEFYETRALLTQRLIRERGFNAVAVEADWPDAYRVNRFVRGRGWDGSPEEAMGDVTRFPRWMWRNREVARFVAWLRAHNLALPDTQRIGFYGLDLYSLHSSIEAVIAYLDKVDPEAARRARDRYGCFEQFAEDPQQYGYAAALNVSRSCEDEAVAQLVELRRRAGEYLSRDGWVARDEVFYAEQNARLARNAEEYYRTMLSDRVSSWNLRDRHMAQTIDALLAHLGRPTRPAKLVVWAHNSHLGDARATEVSRHGELNVGQLVRQRYGAEARLIGFTTYSGTVSAASDWGLPVERKRIRPALEGSYEALLHETTLPAFLLTLREGGAAAEALRPERLERAIGVIYRPDTERASHYFLCRLPDQFDAVIHLDHTRAVEPLELTPAWEKGELPETYPTGV